MARKLVYAPEGAEPREWVFDPDRMRSPELEAIEDATGWTTAEWLDLLGRGSMRALRALVWVNLRQHVPDLEFSAVSFDATEVNFVTDDAEEADGPKEAATDSAESGTGD